MKTTIAVIVFVAGYVAAAASAMDQSTSKKQGYDDRPFLCAAMFKILMEGHLDPAEKDDHNRFKTRFDALHAWGRIVLPASEELTTKRERWCKLILISRALLRSRKKKN
ncbi:hypothetical protein GOD82_26695 [Sinorhizobium medicae]|nr:hypothetical protein [Sinorhizobium medicae]